MNMEDFISYCQKLEIEPTEDGNYLPVLQTFIDDLLCKEDRLDEEEKRFAEARRQLSEIQDDEMEDIIVLDSEVEVTQQQNTEFNELKAKIEILEDQLEKTANELSSKDAAIEQLEKNGELLRQRMGARNAEDVSHFENQISNLEKELEQRKRAAEAAEKSEEEKTATIRDLTTKVSELEDELQQLEETRQQDRSRDVKDTKAVEEANIRVMLLQRELELQLREISIKEFDNRRKPEQINAPEESYDNSQDIKLLEDAYDAEILDKEEEIRNLLEERQQLKAALNEEVAKNDMVVEALLEHEEEMEEQKMKLDILKEEKQQLVEGKKAAEEEIEELQKQLEVEPEPIKSSSNLLYGVLFVMSLVVFMTLCVWKIKK